LRLQLSSWFRGDRTDQVRIAVGLVAGLLHVVQAVLFTVVGFRVLAMASAVAVGIFLVMIWLVTVGRGRLATWLALTEMLLHMTSMVIVFGLGSGYWIYLVLIAGGTHLAFRPTERIDRLITTLVPVGMAALLFLVCHDRAPLIALEARWVTGLALLNVAGAFVAQIGTVSYAAAAVDRAETRAEHERQRSEKLLLNILPAAIAARLKDGPATISDSFAAVTVLFADLVGFTTLSAKLSTEQLIVLLNEIFSSFDALAEQHGLEKIKTIGDAYMVVGGIPEARADHALAVARMALAMREAIAARPLGPEGKLDLRIGIHSGPVVAGVIGTRKFSYDLWGDTVNTASRMESHSEPGRIQVSGATFALLESRFSFEERGEIQVKGKGAMRTYFLTGTRA
jgi:adenylate cyclase